MKKAFIILVSRYFLLLSFVVLCGQILFAQDTKEQRESQKEAELKKWITARRYDFVAQTALPMSGASRQLTSEYDLKIKYDTVEAFLPYFGRAYTAPIGQSSGGIAFKSIKFDYDLSQAKKGGWNISIRPTDVKQDNYRLSLTISQSGYGSLTVTCNNRQPISFNGYIRDIK